jgi:hypothetical protein
MRRHQQDAEQQNGNELSQDNHGGPSGLILTRRMNGTNKSRLRSLSSRRFGHASDSLRVKDVFGRRHFVVGGGAGHDISP